MDRRLLFGLLALAGCGNDGGPPPAGSLIVFVEVGAGGDADTNGFQVIVEQDTVFLPSNGGAAAFHELPAGRRVARLAGLAPWCDAIPLIQGMTIVDGETAILNIAVQCRVALGTVRLHVLTDGIDRDLDGYQIDAGGLAYSTPVNGVVDIALPASRPGLVVVSGIRRSCWPDHDSLTVVPGAPGSVVTDTIRVHCGIILFSEIPIGGPTRLMAANVVTSALRKVTDLPSDAQGMARSSDGEQIAFSNGNGPQFDLYTVTLASGVAVQRTSTPYHEYGVTWLPDGTGLIYASEDSTTGLRRLTLATGIVTPIPGGEVGERRPVIRPQGDSVAYIRTLDGQRTAWVMAIDGTGRHQIWPSLGYFVNLNWSPDGTRLAAIAAASDTSAMWRLYVGVPNAGMPTDISPPVLGWLGDQSTPQWSNDGEWLAMAYNPWYVGGIGFGILRVDGSSYRDIDFPRRWNQNFVWGR